MFALFSYESFFSVWYWVLTVTVWTAVCQRTLDVPHDMVLRAARDAGVAARVETLARIGAERLAGLADAGGAILAAAAGFALASLAALGFWSGVEAAAAAFLLLAPLGLKTAGDVALARRVVAGALSGEALRRGLARRRAQSQALGALAILTAVVVGFGYGPPRF